MIYIRKDKCSPWHYARNCSRLPKTRAEIVESPERPTTGELCNECRSKERHGVAQPITESNEAK